MEENEEKIKDEISSEEPVPVPAEPEQAPAEAEEAEAAPVEKEHVIKNKVMREILSWVFTIVLAMLIAIIINTYFFRISRVSGHSMDQSFYDGEIVFISRAPYIFGDIDQNDIVIFDSTFKERNFFMEVKEALKYNLISYKLFGVEPPENYYIKRVIAVAGDTVQITEDGVFVNGKLLEEPYVNPAEEPRYSVREELRNGVTVPEGKIFVMGDNRNHSTDSRVIGFVPEGDVIGKVIGH